MLISKIYCTFCHKKWYNTLWNFKEQLGEFYEKNGKLTLV